MNEDCIKSRGRLMYWATSTFKVVPDPELDSALRQWAGHIAAAHPGVREVRCHKHSGGTTVIWQEGFENFHDYQELIDQEDGECAQVMARVFQHMVPGTRDSRLWADGL